MAIRGNIGNIRAAIDERRRAFDSVGYGPVVPATIGNIESSVGDWGIQIVDPNIFVWGTDKWANPILKVTS